MTWSNRLAAHLHELYIICPTAWVAIHGSFQIIKPARMNVWPAILYITEGCGSQLFKSLLTSVNRGVWPNEISWSNGVVIIETFNTTWQQSLCCSNLTNFPLDPLVTDDLQTCGHNLDSSQDKASTNDKTWPKCPIVKLRLIYIVCLY